jgi:hypothetical protein
MRRIKKIQKAIDFIEYISKPMDIDDVKLMYRIHGVTPERTVLYLDFIHGLFDLVTSTYLGDDVMGDEDIENHFKWCWTKTLSGFKKERVYFLDDKELYSYFHSLFSESFYKEEDKSDENVNQLMSFWISVFDYNLMKTMSELEAFIDLYKIFNNSLYV